MAKTAAKTAGKRTRNTAPASEPGGPPDLSHIHESLRQFAVPIVEIHPNPHNARIHKQANIDIIKGSFRQFGHAFPIQVQRSSNRLISGHGRLMAAQQLYAEGDHRWAYLAVDFKDWSDEECRNFAIADNLSSETSEWDEAKLEEELRKWQAGNELLDKGIQKLAEEQGLIISDDDLEEPEGVVEEVPERFQILITCTDETHQRILLEELENRGVECRAIVS
jgi:ParB-like chromosome segregation protein Spo0J